MEHNKTSKIIPQQLADMWNIDIATAQRMLSSLSYNNIRTPTTNNISRRYITLRLQKIYKQHGGYLEQFESDIFKSNVTSLRGNNYCVLFPKNANYTSGAAIKTKSEAPKALDHFLHEVGAPSQILTDGGKNYTLVNGGKYASDITFRKNCRNLIHLGKTPLN